MSVGILIFKGMSVGVLPGDMSMAVGECGELKSKIVLSTAYNVLPLWLRIANDSLLLAQSASRDITSQWGEDEDSNKRLLVAELTASLQVFVSCGIALDALYDQLMPHAKIDQATRDLWNKNKTSRECRIFEVIRRIYKLNNTVSLQFRKGIKQIIKLRNQAVHPSLELRNTCTRPDIPVGVDWNFSAYRCSNSEICFYSTMKMLIFLYENQCGNKTVDDQIRQVLEALEELGVVNLTTNQTGDSSNV